MLLDGINSRKTGSAIFLEGGDQLLHVMQQPVRVGGSYFSRCCCGYYGEGQDTPGAAERVECVFAEAERVAVITRGWFLRSQAVERG